MTRFIFVTALLVIIACLILSVFGYHFNLRGFMRTLSAKNDWKRIDMSKFTNFVDNLKTDVPTLEDANNWGLNDWLLYIQSSQSQIINYLIDGISAAVYASGVVVGAFYLIGQVLVVFLYGTDDNPGGMLPDDPNDYPYTPITPPEIDPDSEPA